MARKPTDTQAAILGAMRAVRGPVRPIEVVCRGHVYLPWTESTARGSLEAMCRQGWVRRLPGSPAHYELNELPAKEPPNA